MLDELLKYDRLGNKDELSFFLFEGVFSNEIRVSHLKNYCINKKFSIARSFNAILRLCELVSFIEIKDGVVYLNKNEFDPSVYDKDTYFDDFHFFRNLMNYLVQNNLFDILFNEESTRYSHEEEKYYVIESKIPYNLFIFKNLLHSLGFFCALEGSNHLYINANFNSDFSSYIGYSHDRQERVNKKMSIRELKELIVKKEALGKEAELAALYYETSIFKNHPCVDMIRLISDENVNAGYDIESFLDEESIFINKYIEVKSYSGSTISFYWSKNELEAAKKYQRKYFLYIINRDNMADYGYKPFMIQNPYSRIYLNELWSKDPQSWHITYNGSL